MFRVQLNPPNTGVPCGSQGAPQIDRMSVADEAPELDFALDLSRLPTESGMVPVDGTGIRGQFTTYSALVDAYQRRLQMLFIGPAATTSDPPDRKSGSAGMPRPISYAVFCLKKKRSILTVCCPAAS
eukprot:TRINITY_DN1161_c0_g1_i22.p2 TRINITY_DN1161_c0_g1~~TRINITY_DN1161_c0_g1_i22.p2  ORF type:complete len:127 (-),score=27.13 TRINITY_DN1161_c0_g1_i22:95-475(-)